MRHDLESRVSLVARELHLAGRYVTNETILARVGKRVHDRHATMVFTNVAAGACRSMRRRKRRGLTGCPWHDVKAMLREVGLRPTRQRMALGWMLFGKGDRHITAEMLYEEATKAKVPVSLATVYNTLHQFTDVGLLRQVAVDGSKTYFDTNAIAASPFLRRGRECAARYRRQRRGRRQDAGPAGRLRDRAHRRGGPPAPQGALSNFVPALSLIAGFVPAIPLLATSRVHCRNAGRPSDDVEKHLQSCDIQPACAFHAAVINWRQWSRETNAGRTVDDQFPSDPCCSPLSCSLTATSAHCAQDRRPAGDRSPPSRRTSPSPTRRRFRRNIPAPKSRCRTATRPRPSPSSARPDRARRTFSGLPRRTRSKC